MTFDQLYELYDSVGWVAYTHEQRRAELPEAIVQIEGLDLE